MNGVNFPLNLDLVPNPWNSYTYPDTFDKLSEVWTIALHFETVLVGILNVLVPVPVLAQRNIIYILPMREPTPSPLNENAKYNFPPPPPTTYNGPKPHPFPQQTLSNIYWIVPELQPSLIFLPSKDLQCQIAPHCVAEKEFHSRVLLKSSSVANVYVRIRRSRNVLSLIINSNMYL